MVWIGRQGVNLLLNGRSVTCVLLQSIPHSIFMRQSSTHFPRHTPAELLSYDLDKGKQTYCPATLLLEVTEECNNNSKLNTDGDSHFQPAERKICRNKLLFPSHITIRMHEIIFNVFEL